MFRYFVLATAIVVGSCIAVTGWVNRDLIRIKIASVYASARPKAEPSSAIGNGSRSGLRGDAPWALSAFPECLQQTSESTGSLAYVLAHLPSGAVEVAPPSTLVYGDCTVFFSGDEAYVRRGTDRFRIPPRVRLYRTPHALALLHEGPLGGNDLRVYEPVKTASPHE